MSLTLGRRATFLLLPVIVFLCWLGLGPGQALAAEGHLLAHTFGAATSTPANAYPLADPTDVAVDTSGGTSNGDFYVTDTTAHRVEKFDATGHLLWIIGKEVDKTATQASRSAAEQDLCVIASGDTCKAGASSQALGGFEEPEYVAVDDSPGGEGDLYVADLGGGQLISKFAADGHLLESWATGGQLTGNGLPEGFSFTGRGGIGSIAVGRAGNLYVFLRAASNSEHLGAGGTYVLSSAGQVVGNVDRGSGTGAATVDAVGDLYYFSEGSFALAKVAPDGTALEEEVDATNPSPKGLFYTGLAVDPEGEDLYVDNGGSVTRLDSGATRIESAIGYGGELTEGKGLAVGPDHSLYVADRGAGDVTVFTLQQTTPPTASIEAVASPGYTRAEVSGTADPDGFPTSCRFEYVTQARFEVEGFDERHFDHVAERQQAQTAGYRPPSVASCATQPGAGSAPVPVASELEGLLPNTTYRLRLVAVGQGEGSVVASTEESFETKEAELPTVTIVAPTGVTGTTAQLSGHIDPNAPQPMDAEIEEAFAVTWHFACTPRCPGAEAPHSLGAGGVEEEVSLRAQGLLPGTDYQLRLVASAAGGSADSTPVALDTPAEEPRVDATQVVSTNATEATVLGLIDPRGAATTVHVDYISEENFLADGEAFGGGTVEGPESAVIGTAASSALNCTETEEHEGCVSDVRVQATIPGLDAATDYRFRFVANNIESPSGGTVGPVGALSTRPSGPGSSGCPNESLRTENDSLLLPDCRAYEQVSPADNAEAFVPPSDASLGPGEGYATTSTPMQAATDGSSIVYVAEPPTDGSGEGTGNAGGGEGDQQLARRGGSGWTVTDIQPLGSGPSSAYQGFSAELAFGVLATGAEEPLSTEVETPCPLLYSRAGTGPFRPLFTTEGACPVAQVAHSRPAFVGASADGSHLLFESAAKKPTADVVSGAGVAEGEGHENIYDSTGGELHLVNILPGGAHRAAPNATLGGLTGEPSIEISGGAGTITPSVAVDGAVSTDGSRIYWTDLAVGNGDLYVRENDAAEPSEESSGRCTERQAACTVRVSAGPATYEAATPDGHYAYYTESGRLLRFDLDAFNVAIAEGQSLETADAAARSAVTPAGAAVQGVIGLNETGEDGAYLYFVAEGALAPGAEARECGVEGETTEQQREEAEGSAPPGRGCNLYLAHEGSLSFVATLLPGDDEFSGNHIGKPHPKNGDWRPVLGYRSAEPSADGSHLVFMSSGRLTSYPNLDPAGSAVAEIYVFDAGSDKVLCASCDPSGAGPGTESQLGAFTFLPLNFNHATEQHRWISAGGTRLFFDTDRSLVPADVDGAEDVYEWEAPGTGSCKRGSAADGGGCVYLLSGGSGPAGSFLIDTDEEGRNAFFVTRSALIPTDRGDKPDLYDARVEGGFPVPAAASTCKERGACAGGSSAAPVLASPATPTFRATEESASVKCAKKQIKKHGRCIKRPKPKNHKKMHKHRRSRHHKDPQNKSGVDR
jgi:hypothetical protein